jgi:hypothetical protein
MGENSREDGKLDVVANHEGFMFVLSTTQHGFTVEA